MNEDQNNSHNPRYDEEGETLVKEKLREPPLYKVILLNDDFTPMDFVVHILKKFFQKNEEEAQRIMWAVHSQGKGIAGLYPYDVAETKVYQVNQYSKQKEHPLKIVMEEDNAC